MEEGLGFGGEAGGEVGVEVACEEDGLEEHQADGPDGGAPAEPGEDRLGEQGLHLEQQERAQEDRDGVRCVT